MFENRLDLSTFHQSVEQFREEVSKVIVGQDSVVELMLIALLSNGHILLEGVPGVAKTLMAKLFARLCHVSFSRIQFTPDLMPSDVIGTSIFNLKSSEFEFRQGPVFANIILIDEINRAPAKTQSALFEVMEERQITFDGHTYPLSAPFIVMATQNPIEQEGTYPLPEAQLDRFLFKIKVGYPDIAQEKTILAKTQAQQNLSDLSKVIPCWTADTIAECKKLVQNIHVEDSLLDYIARIVVKTRQHPSLFLGASPRASLAILNTAKAYAAIHNRDFVAPDDIKAVTIPALNHRLILTPEKEMEGIGIEKVVEQIIQSVEVPR